MPAQVPENKDQFTRLARDVLFGPKAAFNNVAAFRSWLYTLAADGQKATVKTRLVALFSLTTDEANSFVEAIEAEHAIGQVAEAQGTVVAPNDFFFEARKVWGVNLTR